MMEAEEKERMGATKYDALQEIDKEENQREILRNP